MKKIVILGPNTARQKTLFFDQFQRDGVNRARQMTEIAASKGINFLRALRCWGDLPGVLIQFCGGYNGRLVTEYLQEEGLSAIAVPTAAETRCCITCLDEHDHTMTEVIEPSHAATTQEVQNLLAAFECELPDASGAAFCGSLPDGTDPHLYAQAARILARYQLPLLVDAFRNLDELFASGVQVVLKINREELTRMTGQNELKAGLQTIFARYSNLQFAAITDGPHCAYASDGVELKKYELPPLPAPVVSPLGCGDTASSVLLSSLVAGQDQFVAFAQALGAASANCLNAKPGSFDREIARSLMPQQIQSLGKLRGGALKLT